MSMHALHIRYNLALLAGETEGASVLGNPKFTREKSRVGAWLILSQLYGSLDALQRVPQIIYYKPFCSVEKIVSYNHISPFTYHRITRKNSIHAPSEQSSKSESVKSFANKGSLARRSRIPVVSGLVARFGLS